MTDHTPPENSQSQIFPLSNFMPTSPIIAESDTWKIRRT